MATLREQIGKESIRPLVIDECVLLIDKTVKAKGGVSGVAIKGAYGAVKRLKKNFVKEVVEALLDDWLVEMEPFYAKWLSVDGSTFPEFVTARSEDVADALLKVTDDRAANTKHKTAGKLYRKLRGSAKKNVMEAVPGLATIIEKHLESSGGGDTVAA